MLWAFSWMWPVWCWVCTTSCVIASLSSAFLLPAHHNMTKGKFLQHLSASVSSTYKIMIINTFFTALWDNAHIKCLAHECLNMVMVEAGQELNKEEYCCHMCAVVPWNTFSGLCVSRSLWKPNCRRFWVMCHWLTLGGACTGSWTGSLAHPNTLMSFAWVCDKKVKHEFLKLGPGKRL